MTQPLAWNLHGNDQLSGVLEKLDRTLDKVAKHLNGVTGDAKRMGQALGQAEQKTSTFSSGVSHAGEQLDGFRGKTVAAIGTLGRFAAAGVAAFGLAGAAAAGYGVQMAAANETAFISFELLLGSAEKATTFLKKLQDFAAATPFGMPELKSAASRLLAVGTATDKIIPLLTRLGDATAGMGTGAEGIDRAVYALQQMSQAGKVSLEDINQLTDAGIPALESLSAKLGIKISELRDRITKGTIKPEQLFDAILEGSGKGFQRLQGMMKRQSASLAGIWSTFKDNAGQALATFVEPAMPALKATVDWLSTAVPKALGFLDKMRTDIGRIFKDSPMKGEFTTALRAMVDKVLPALKQGWADLSLWIEENRDKLEKIGRFITHVVIPVFGQALVIAIGLTVGAVKAAINIASWLVDAWSWAVRMFVGFMQDLIHAAEHAFQWVPGLGPQLRQAAKDVDVFTAKVLADLDAIDGKKVTVAVGFKSAERSADGPTPRDPFKDHNRAFGGPTWAGETYTWNERGTEKFYANVSGRIESAADGRSRASRGGGEDMVTIRVVVETPDGKVLRTELLSYKRSSGLTSLGLA